MTPLQGGRDGIYLEAGRVHRPQSAASASIQELLGALQTSGFEGAPLPHGFDESGGEVVSFVEGLVGNDPAPPALRTDAALESVARLLADLHDRSASVLEQWPDLGDAVWNLPTSQPVELICHGDIAPYNTVFRDGLAVGFIDFDAAHPGSRARDVSYALYRTVPLGHHDEAALLDLPEQLRRVGLFSTAYSDDPVSADITAELVTRLRDLIELMHSRAELGDRHFQENVNAGHDSIYRRDIEFLESHADQINQAFLGTVRDP